MHASPLILCHNVLENKLVNIVDRLAALKEQKSGTMHNNEQSSTMKRLINRKRKCVAKWKRLGRNSDNENVINIKNEIRKTVYNERKNKIQREIKPCSSKSLWNAVKIAKDQDTSQIPDEMHLNEQKVNHFTKQSIRLL